MRLTLRIKILLSIIEWQPKLESISIFLQPAFPLHFGTLKNTLNLAPQRTMISKYRFSSSLFSMMLYVINFNRIVVMFVPPEGLLRCEHIFEGWYTFLFAHYYKFIIWHSIQLRYYLMKKFKLINHFIKSFMLHSASFWSQEPVTTRFSPIKPAPGMFYRWRAKFPRIVGWWESDEASHNLADPSRPVLNNTFLLGW